MVPKNPNKLSNLTGLSKRDRLQWRRKVLLFSFFLGLSFIIWVLNALSKNYTTVIEYPITYTNFPENKVMIGKLPDHLGLKVNAHGYALLQYKLSNRPVPINFRISSFSMNRFDDDSSKFYLLTRYARDQMARQLPSDLELLEVSPDSLVMQLANEVNRSIPVKPVLKFQTGNQFTVVGDIQVVPDSVLVSGPDIMLDTMKWLRTEKMNLGILEKSYKGVLRINPVSGIQYTPGQVQCMIDLEKFTEVQLYVPIQISGLPENVRMQTFPPNIKVTGVVGLSNYGRILPEAFWVEVDYREVLEEKERIRVNMKRYPEFLVDIEYYPETVEYLISFK